jgi:hypothetical protein
MQEICGAETSAKAVGGENTTTYQNVEPDRKKERVG